MGLKDKAGSTHICNDKYISDTESSSQISLELSTKLESSELLSLSLDEVKQIHSPIVTPDNASS